MESRALPSERSRAAQVVVRAADGSVLTAVPLSGARVTVGRLPDANDIALQPDPERLVTRAAHCSFEREGSHWFIADGGSVNGTLLRRTGEVTRVAGRVELQDGDVVCVLASIGGGDERRYFELAFQATPDSQATRAVPIDRAVISAQAAGCLTYDSREARLVLVHGDERTEIQVRAQAHRLVRYMAERNTEAGGAPALCTHDELMQAVWGDEPMHTRTELARLVWELRRKLEPFGASHLIESERRRGYRLRTCRDH
jgi:DNA-binding winged helix-turn-helix (wHTH) protein